MPERYFTCKRRRYNAMPFRRQATGAVEPYRKDVGWNVLEHLRFLHCWVVLTGGLGCWNNAPAQ